MNSGLYALAGVSETAKAAAWAKRLDWPMTNDSKTYLGFSRALESHSAEAAPAVPWSSAAERPGAAAGTKVS